MLAHRGGGEAAVATTAVTARGKASVCQTASIVTSPAEETRDHPCLAAVVEEGNVVDADQVRGGRKAAGVVAEGGERMASPLEARDRRRRPRSWMLKWRITSEAAATVVLVQRPTMVLEINKTVERLLLLLRLLPRSETTTSI